VIGLKLLLAYLIPDIPGPVKRAIDRESYLARLALEGVTEEGEADGDIDMEENLFKEVIDDYNRLASDARKSFKVE